jgi:uncharacterized repeat protein (TIGR04076 family)
MESWTNDGKVMSAARSDGVRPVIFNLELIDEAE